MHGKNPASVRSVQSETKKKLADDWSFQESKKTGNDRQLFFHLVLTSSVASLQSAKTATSFSAPYILYICICITPCIYVWSIAKTRIQSLEKDFSSEEFSLQ